MYLNFYYVIVIPETFFISKAGKSFELWFATKYVWGEVMVAWGKEEFMPNQFQLKNILKIMFHIILLKMCFMGDYRIDRYILETIAIVAETFEDINLLESVKIMIMNVIVTYQVAWQWIILKQEQRSDVWYGYRNN